MKLPAFQFYPGDWRKDPGIQSLTFEERGIWVELLCLMHESESRGKLMIGGEPYPIERLARMFCLSPEVMGKVISTLITLGVASRCENTGALICRRMVRDEKLREVRAKAGHLGGNPSFKKGKANPYYKKDDKQKDNLPHNQKITPSSSSSVSTSVVSFEPAARRERNAQFDALLEIEGIPQNEIGASGGRIATALKNIRLSTPEVTPEEIRQRAENYRSHFEGAAVTATALAKHWGKCHEANTIPSRRNTKRAGFADAY